MARFVMTDEQLAEYLNAQIELMPKIKPKQRALYERMADVEMEIKLWRAGVGDKPKGVILCGCKHVKP